MKNKKKTYIHTHTLALLIAKKGRYFAKHAGTDTCLHRLRYSHKTYKKMGFPKASMRSVMLQQNQCQLLQ